LRVVVTRAAHQVEELADPLRALGFEVILLPVIGIAPPADPGPLLAAARSCDRYDWIIFSSVNAVEAFAAHITAPPRSHIATVGAATRAAAERAHLQVALTPDEYIAEALVEAFAQEDLRGKRILIPSAAVTRDVIAPALRQRGADVTVVEAYRNVIPEDAAQQAGEIFREPFPDCVAFASSSAVANLIKIAGAGPLGRSKLASIGPATSATIRKHGLEPAAEAVEHTVQGLVNAVSSCGRVHEET
jgi:uroporphyrinogen-III synthase